MNADAGERGFFDVHRSVRRQPEPELVILAEKERLIEPSHLGEESAFDHDGGKGDDGIDPQQGFQYPAAKRPPGSDLGIVRVLSRGVDPTECRVPPSAAAAPEAVELLRQLVGEPQVVVVEECDVLASGDRQAGVSDPRGIAGVRQKRISRSRGSVSLASIAGVSSVDPSSTTTSSQRW